MPQTIDSGGCTLSYQVQGNGPNVLFIQGVGVHGNGWKPQIEALSDRFTCLSFDNRGMGLSQPAGRPITLEQMTADARTILDAAGWSSAHVVGHSLGGLVALSLALSARERVKSLSLLCTFANGKSAAPLTPRMMWWGLRSRVGTRTMRRRGFMHLLLPPAAIASTNLDDLAHRLTDLFGHDLADQPAIVNAQLKAMRAGDCSSRLGELSDLRTLVVCGRYDPIAPPSCGKAIAAEIADSTYIEMEDASHGLPITHAERVNTLLLEHLRAAEGHNDYSTR